MTYPKPTAEDWIILRLMYQIVKRGGAAKETPDFPKACLFMLNKLGKQGFSDALDTIVKAYK
jgi:hypothetical protein